MSDFTNRIGFGYDTHKLELGQELVIGGVKISHEAGLIGHSDADVLVHAIIDALLGASSLGDIGMFFPDTNPSYKNISSLKLLKTVVKILKKKNFRIINLDSTIVAQSPKLTSFFAKMKENIAESCEIPSININIKAKTEEGLGFTGKKEGISAYAVALLELN
ncbi:MAG: 2-C-methyl-D-erythritol 2,4-cyclodiphosphate synthase [Oscillospiraceae bacterium]|jgi:2-C-methyl-D-erythritol 2,4-cyclodiphosphate synthase|nr:2-C-methyl-D-erythritol 2,4-cyclodiphosphate synthase [Oscillospiraceae bacterium]